MESVHGLPRRNLIAWILAFALVLVTVVAQRESAFAAYPERSIEMIAWASPGGGSDLMTRTFAKAAEGIIPQPIYVVNRPGGGGAIGMAYVAGQPADGYTILGVTNNLVFTPLSQPAVRQDYTSFDMIGIFGLDPKIIAVSADSPYQSVDDLVDAAESGTSVTFGLFGVGTDDHIVSYLLAEEAGVQWTYIPFGGGGEQLAAVLGGHVDAMVTEPGEVVSQVEAGNIRIIGVATAERVPAMATVPTLVEQGYDVQVPKWRGFVVKEGTPPDVVAYLRDKFDDVVHTDFFQQYINDNLMQAVWIKGEDMRDLIADQMETFGRVLEEITS